MSPYTGSKRKVYEEALRTVPGLMAARVRGADDDAFTLTKLYLDFASQLGVETSTAWSVMAAASQATLLGVINLAADLEEVSPGDVVERIIATTTQMVATGEL